MSVSGRPLSSDYRKTQNRIRFFPYELLEASQEGTRAMHRTFFRTIRRLLSDAVSALAVLHGPRPRDEPRPLPAPPPPPPPTANSRSRAKMAYRMNAAAHRSASVKPGRTPGRTDRSPLHDCAD